MKKVGSGQVKPIKEREREKDGKAPRKTSSKIFNFPSESWVKCKCSGDFLREFMERQIESNGHRAVSADVP